MGDVIPSRKEIVRDLIKWFATEYGLDLVESVFDSWSAQQIAEAWKKRQAKLKSSGSGGALLLLLLFAFASSKGKGR